MRSEDGISWEVLIGDNFTTTESSGSINNLRSSDDDLHCIEKVVFAFNKFYAVGKKIYSSIDGITWDIVKEHVNPGRFVNISFSGRYLYTYTYNYNYNFGSLKGIPGNLFRSEDAIKWDNLSLSSQFTNVFASDDIVLISGDASSTSGRIIYSSINAGLDFDNKTLGYIHNYYTPGGTIFSIVPTIDAMYIRKYNF